MKFTKERKEKILYYLLQKINDGDKEFIKKTSANFSVSLTTLYRYLEELQRERVIKKKANNEFELINKKEAKLYRLKDNLEEDIVYKDIVEGFVKEFPNNIKRFGNIHLVKCSIMR